MAKLYDKNLKAVLNKIHTKVFTLTDGNGLGARVSPHGKISWQYRYKIDARVRGWILETIQIFH